MADKPQEQGNQSNQPSQQPPQPPIPRDLLEPMLSYKKFGEERSRAIVESEQKDSKHDDKK